LFWAISNGFNTSHENPRVLEEQAFDEGEGNLSQVKAEK
jgi:hypothetical protein